ncbi:MAG: TIGR03790 family protein [Rhodospirillaceae bacterium]
MLVRLSLSLLLGAVALASHAQESVLRPQNVAVVVNDADATSVAVGEYYRDARNVPPRNVVHVTIPGSPRVLSAGDFHALKRRIDAALPSDIEVVVMAWTAPYAVECNSITSAYSLGLDLSLCTNACTPGKANPYFDTMARRPYREIGMRLSMLLPSDDVELAKAVVDRGRLSGFRMAEASAYFVITSDAARNARTSSYPPTQRIPAKLLDVKTLRADSIANRDDVMIYEIGAVSVSHLETLKFLPGALADHMTSLGGDLLGQSQMSSLRWLRAGATASYGTVSEPCSYWQKFPHPSVLLKHYLQGATAIEAYWKSVAWPAQGVFIGEPLAAPYCRSCATVKP